ncbi:LPS export ABC transporter permease LptG [Rhodovulum adriaticum]|uniref:Lipopolysaccharide export system permease protein n=1 Tax=Rhodovulum adriaticum TaxID=35804 RepID=A0A4R2NP79_RHOAD|nr:LPS export ABC transporter permease LptG [Rhodovulum adriaticum]MBK1634516.1 LPS export ABC transporter permease LptG [Rhodovulum adriaticum]TCP23114.1 lipopolysaccharide export system permease protein [Rhodovulum adriaticum]
MTLHLYFARKFAISLLTVTALFTALFLLIDMVEQLRRFDIGVIGPAQALHLSALKVPADLYGLLPLIVLLATVALFLGLARTSELVVTRASGRSALRSLVAPVATAVALGAGAVAVLNPIVAATTTQYETVATRYSQDEISVLSVSDEGLWLRQGTPEGQMVIHAARTDADATRFIEVTFLGFDLTGDPRLRIAADHAILTPAGWDIRNAKRWDLGPDTANPEASATLHDRLALPSDLTRERIRDSFASPSAIPIWELPAFIQGMERAGFSARAHRVWLQTEFARPVLLAAMVLLGAGFTMRHSRFGRTGTMVMLAFAAGLGLVFLRNFAQVLGEIGEIPVALAAWSPPAAGILLSLGLLLHLEDG